ncbi:MAG TPA: peroxiredoxin-like family protein [Dongiaceae bacterium]|jgi:peroxiredoxin|nr:peroxiredoxin-like family protein [Dongiaceae bacterium]
MSLTQEIEKFKQEMAQVIHADAMAIIQKAQEELVAAGTGAGALRQGDQAKDAVLSDIEGRPVRLSDLWKNQPVVLVFYRGGWCPFCNLELQAYQRAVPEFQKAGVAIAAISPERAEHGRATRDKHTLSFPLLTDTDNQAARLYGLLFDVPAMLKPIYQKFGVDLMLHNTTGAWSLPVPGTFAIAKGGKIERALVDVNYTNRLEPGEALAALL